jgi:hypothetical protein
MRLVNSADRAQQAAAINTIRELLDSGIAGLDCYDTEIFVVDAPAKEIRDNADVALDVLGASFHRDGAFGATRGVLQCWLPRWVRVELDLERRDAPRLIVPLASRAVRLDQLIDDVAGVNV